MGVKFKESGHKYYTLDDKELLAVSNLMKRFEPKVNWDKKAEKKAKELGCTKQEVLDLWAMKRDKGSQAGTIIHRLKEEEILNGQHRIVQSTYDNDFKYALNVGELENNTVYPELMIYDLDSGVCGQSDLVAIENNIITVIDHKTDKSIDFRGFGYKWGTAEKYEKPLSHLEVCNGNTYSLKMSLYMYLIWKANKGRFKPGKLLLNWCPIRRDEEGVPILDDNGIPIITSEHEIEIPYRKKEVMAMLATLK